MSKKSTLSTTALKTLTTMALAIPGIHHARSENAITQPQADFRYSRIDEGSFHYQIDVYQASLGIALAPQMDMTIKANQDVMSGVSTVSYVPQALLAPGGSNTQLSPARTGATIVDKRSAGDVNVRYFGEDYNVGIGGGLSEENFYESQSAHIQFGKTFNKSNTEFFSGYTISNDSIRPTINSNSILRPLTQPRTRQGKVTQKVYMDVKQDLSNTSLIQAGVEFIADKGFLDDPYKLVFIYGNPNRSNQAVFFPGFGSPYAVPSALCMDTRPDYKATLATSARFIQYLTQFNSSIHFGFRFVKNTWNIKSYTLNLDYYQEIEDSWQIVPSLRYYTQSEAYFYAMSFDAIGSSPLPAKLITSSGPASSDYRLARFGSITGELKIHYKFLKDKSGKLTFAAGLIDRRNKYYWGHKPYPPNPDNDYKTVYGSVGISLVF